VCNIKGKKLLERFPGYGKTAIYNHAKKEIGKDIIDNRKWNKGRPRKISSKTTRLISREVLRLQQTGDSFSSKDIQHNTGCTNVSNRTVRRYMNTTGYLYLHLRRKGVVTKDDMKIRKKWARNCKKKLPDNFWREGVSLYYDGVGFEYKRNPATSSKGNHSMGWRRKNQGLDEGCTRKGKKEGKVNAKFYVAISYNKGVVMCVPYEKAMNAEQYIENVVPKMVRAFTNSNNPKSKRLLQDNCPIQNASVVKRELDEMGVTTFKIPARSPDVNCIENFFAQVRVALDSDVKKRGITSETFSQFQHRVMHILTNMSVNIVNKLIDSMWSRIEQIIKRNGQRIKY
jgi:hypothetical protein